MAKISVVASPFDEFLLWDLDKVQQLREHTVHPAGQERYIKPTDLVALDAYLTAEGVTEDAAAVVAGTVDADDISLANIDAVTTEALTVDQQQAIQDLLAVTLIETGNMQLSFDRGVLAKLVELGWIKVFTDAGDALYAL